MSSSVADTLDAAISELGIDTGEPPVRYPFGIRDWDAAVGGMLPGHMAVLGAQDGTGKSSIVLSALLRQEGHAGMLSTQDGPAFVGARLLSMQAGVPFDHVFRNKLTPEEISKVAKASKHLKGRHLSFRYTSQPRKALEEIDDMFANGCNLVWVDYLQGLVTSVEAIDHFLRELSGICARTNGSAVLVSQIRKRHKNPRTGELEDLSPEMLKGSNAIASAARMVSMAEASVDGTYVQLRTHKLSWGPVPPVVVFKRTPQGLLKELTRENT